MVEPTLNGYRDLTMVAHGSSAFVYRAVQERLEREVAVKVLLVDDEMTTQSAVKKELDTTVSVSNHPHIVSIIDTGTTAEGQPFIVMEYCDGGSYTDILKKHGPLPVADVIDVGIKIGQALHAAHSANIIHRDVKPQNILRGQYGPALVDFGIARATADLASTGTLDKLTPLHASPEAIRRESQTAASDLFSLASTMWHLLAGHAPFANPEGGTDPTTHRQRLEHEPPPKLPREDVPPWLEELIGQALSKEPSHRPQSAQEFSEALQQQHYGSTSAGIVRPTGTAMTMEDLASEQTIYRPSDGSSAANQPMDPFGHHTSSGFTGGGHIESGLGPSQQQMKQMLSGAGTHTDPSQQGNVAPASGAPASEYPVSASPASAAPVSMAPPPTPWNTPGDPASMSAPPYSAPPNQPYSAPPQRPHSAVPAPPVIERTSKKNDDKGSLVPYIVMGSIVTLVLASVMVGWLWVISPNDDESPDDPIDANTEGFEAPEEVEIADNGTTITISWDDPTDGSASFIVLYTREDDDSQYDKLAEANAGSTSTTVNALSDDINYCFRVGVIVAFDEIPQSEPVCTERE